MEQNTKLQKLLLDGKPDEQISFLLERNRNINANIQPSKPRDVAMIRSVYRTATSTVHF